MNTETRPRIFGYARTCVAYADEPIDRQRKLIAEKAETLRDVADFGYTAVDVCGTGTPIAERGEFKLLLLDMRPGDHLIVWRLDRIDRSFKALEHFHAEMSRRQITLHVLSD